MNKLNQIKFIAVIALFFACSTMQAQFSMDKYENIQLLKRIPLLVVLDSPNEKTVNKLTKKDPEAAKKYIAEVKGKNEVIKTSINRKWRMSNDIRFITSTELDTYKTKENNGKYAYITSDVYDKVKSKKSDTGYFAYCNYSLYIVGDVTPVHEMRYSSEYGSTMVSNNDAETVWQDMQSEFKYKETQVAKRMAKKDLKRDTRLAKSKFSDED